MLNIATIGDANSGKSTLWNAVLGQRVLPSAAKSCTAVLAHVSLGAAYVETPMLIAGERVVEGRKQVVEALKGLSGDARTATSSSQAQVFDVAIKSGTREEVFRSLNDGSVKLVDVPAHNEALNPAMMQGFQVALRICHSVLLIVRYDQIITEATAKSLELLLREMPHITHAPSGSPSLAFVITQADLVQNSLDDSDEEFDGDPGGSARSKVEDLKATFCAFVAEKLGQWEADAPAVLAAPVFAISARHVLEPGVAAAELFDWPAFAAHLCHCHATRGQLLVNRKSLMAEAVLQQFAEPLALDSHPRRAAALIEARKNNEEEKFWQNVKYGVFVASTAAFVGAGGWFAYGAAAAAAQMLATTGLWGWLGYGTATAVVAGAAVTGLGLTGGSSERGLFSFAGEWLASGSRVGAVGAEAADKEVTFETSLEAIEAGVECYQDTRLHAAEASAAAAEMPPVYIGEFRGGLPHGQGRAFWRQTGREAIIGNFKAGIFEEGFVIDEHDVLLGRFAAAEGGSALRIEGWQPETQLTEGTDSSCAACLDGPGMSINMMALLPCMHASVCVPCAERVLSAENPAERLCPVCQKPVRRIIRLS